MEADWNVTTVVRVVHCEDDVRKGIEKTLPADSRRRPFTDKDMECLEVNDWEIQEDRMLAIVPYVLYMSGLWFGACGYEERGEFKYMAFGAFPVTKTKLAFVSISRADNYVGSSIDSILPVLMDEHDKMEAKKNERSGKAC